MSRKLTLGFLSDLQTNSTVALCPPVVNLDDGGTYHSSRIQRMLLNNYHDFRDRLVSAKGNGDLYLIFNGDIHDGDHHDTTQIITRNTATMQKIAIETLEPMIKIADKCFMVRGTEAHVGKSAAMEEKLAKDLGFQKNGDNYSWWQLIAEFRGTKFDIAHHTSMGSTPAGRGNAANKIAVETIFEYANAGKTPPDFAIRSHVHRYSDSGNVYRTRAVILPCWQFRTAHVHKQSPGKMATIGGVYIELEENKEPVLTAVIYEPKRTEETIWRE